MTQVVVAQWFSLKLNRNYLLRAWRKMTVKSNTKLSKILGEKNEAPCDGVTWNFECGRSRSITRVPSNHKISELIDWGSRWICPQIVHRILTPNILYVQDLPKAPWVETQENPIIDFSLVYVWISTLLVEPVPTLCPTLSGTKYLKRSHFVARVTIRVTADCACPLSTVFILYVKNNKRNDNEFPSFVREQWQHKRSLST
jgi:hypothetical protein